MEAAARLRVMEKNDIIDRKEKSFERQEEI